jgi:hypothetical protein
MMDNRPRAVSSRTPYALVDTSATGGNMPNRDDAATGAY